jgi:lysophospholipase L1-like esterase
MSGQEGGGLTPRARVLVIVLLGLVILISGGFVTSELYLRTVLMPPRDPRQHVFLHQPLQRLRVVVSEDVPGLARRETLFTSSSLGLRGDELDLSRHDALRVVTLGGSVTECMVLNDADAWPRRLQDELARRTQKPVWVGNAGRSGQMTLDYIAHALVLLPEFNPDVVVIMPGGNDLQAIVEARYFPMDLSNPGLLAKYTEKLYAAGDTDQLDPSYSAYIYDRWLNTASFDLAPLYLKMKAARASAPKLAEIEDFDEALDIYRSNLRALYAMLQRMRPPPRIVFVTHPFLWAQGMGKAEEAALWAGYTCMSCPTQRFYTPEALASSLHAMNAELLEFCAERDLPCFDLEPKLEKTLVNFYDDAHLKEPGARRVAELLGEFLAAQVASR